MPVQPHAAQTLEYDRMVAALQPAMQRIDGLRGRALHVHALDGAAGPVTDARTLPDSPAKLVICDAAHRPVAMAIVSPPRVPDVVAHRLDVGERCRQLLGARLGGVVLSPLDSGVIEECSYAIWPWRHPLSRARWRATMQRRRLRGPLLRWLRESAAATRQANEQRGLDPDFHTPLKFMQAQDILPAPIRHAADEALARLDREHWRPAHVLDHNDLWAGNILLNPRLARRQLGYAFTIIDWGGANLAGFGIFDLVRVAMSFGVRGRRLRRELLAHCRALGVAPTDAPGHLLAALGHIGLNRGHFGESEYARLVDRCWRAIGGEP